MIALKVWAWAIVGLVLLGMMGTKERETFFFCLVVAVSGLIVLWLAP